MSESLNTGLCIVYPNKEIYSETFIRNQLKFINAQFEYHKGWYPYINKNEKNILSFPIKNIILRGAIKRISPHFFHRLYTAQFSNLIRTNRIKVVLAEYGPTGCAVMDACERERIPLIVHFHGFDSSDHATLKKYDDSYRKLFNISRYIVVVSEIMKNELIKLGAPVNKIVNNPYGVDLDFFDGAKPENSPPVFVAVGRFAEKKAPDLTIRAFYEVYKVNQDVKLIMIGDGPLLKSCKDLVNELKLNDNVEFKGVLNREEILKTLKTGRVFVQHSVRAKSGDMEGTPNTILEASATGLPIVSTFHAGISEAVIHQKTGFLVQEHDYLKMAEYMSDLINNPEKAGQYGRNSREYMLEKYSIQYRYSKLRDLMLAAINNR